MRVPVEQYVGEEQQPKRSINVQVRVSISKRSSTTLPGGGEGMLAL
jgi:hypothetical protein